jgi:hypothetical protein
MGAFEAQPPVLGAIGNQSVQAGQNLSFTASATDPDPADTVTLAGTNLPSGATFNSGTGAFSWTPSAAQVGTYTLVHFAASDGTFTDAEDITITVTDNPPVLDPIGDKTVQAGQNLAFTLSATDPQPADVLTFGATGLPSGATLDPTTGAFAWVPSAGQTGAVPVHFTVSDGTLSDAEDITITVTAIPPTPPATNPPSGTGQRAAALKKCKKKKTAAARKKCKKKAKKLPV